ncbi:Uncharacterised protein [uncultured archaeon]|nr:Uncharacterised protein [uncultured archaeon]
MRRVPFTAAILLLILTSVAFAVPGIPNRFHGTVNFIDGPAPDGSVIEAKIDGVSIAMATTTGGKYGHIPNILDINDLNNNLAGKTISFFVNGIDTGETATFTNGKASELNLAVNDYINKNLKVNQQVTNSLSGNTGGSTSNKPCTSTWYCSDWSSCSSNVQTRNCVDINHCTTSTSKPVLSQDCAKPVVSEEKSTSSKAPETTNKGLEQPNRLTGRFLSVTLNNVGAVAVILLIVAITWHIRKKKLRNNATYRQYS